MPGPYKCTHQTTKLLSPMPGDSSILFRQYRIILSADTASEVRQLLSQKRR